MIVIWHDTEDDKACALIEASQALARWVCVEGLGHCGIKEVVLGDG